MEGEASSEENHFPGVSVIVATLNSELTIGECLRSILDLDYPRDLLEVIVIDGGSKDSTVNQVKAHSVKVISRRLNPPAAYNFALKVAKHEVVGFIDSDAKIEKRWLRELVSHLNHPEVAGASGSIATWNNDRLVPRCIGYDLIYRYERLPENVERVATMNLILRKSVIEEVGGFDESFPTQYDTDLGTRITNVGYRIIFDPDVSCYHFNRPTLRDYFKQQLQYGQNTWRLYLKHPRLARGDKITNWSMNIQPMLYCAGALSLVASVITNFNIIALWIFLSLAIITAIYYTFSAARISHAFHDYSAMFLVLIYFIRAVAWTLGGATSFPQGILTIGSKRR